MRAPRILGRQTSPVVALHHSHLSARWNCSSTGQYVRSMHCGCPCMFSLPGPKTLLTQYGVQVELETGSVAFIAIYFTAGIFGNILGGNFALAGLPSVGASGAIFGTVGCLWVDLIAHWRYEHRPRQKARANNLPSAKLVLMMQPLLHFAAPYVELRAHLRDCARLLTWHRQLRTSRRILAWPTVFYRSLSYYQRDDKTFQDCDDSKNRGGNARHRAVRCSHAQLLQV